MDYCVSCRRHLNGALSCPGCGVSSGTPPVPVPSYEAGYAYPAQEDPTGAYPTGAEALPYAPGLPPTRTAARTAGQPRARRRRRPPKRRRGALVLSAVGLVVGGLGAVALSSGPSDGVAAPAGSPDTAQPSPPDGSTPATGSVPTLAVTQGTPGPQPTGHAHPSHSPSPSADPTVPPGPSVRPSATARPGTPQPTPSTPRPSSAHPGPTPTSAPTCHQFLFWCS